MQDKSTIFCYNVMTDINLFYSLKRTCVYVYGCCVVSRFNCIWLFATLWDCSQPGSTVHGILISRTLEWIAILSSGSSQPRIETVSSVAPAYMQYVIYIYIYIWSGLNTIFSFRHYTKAAGKIKRNEKRKKEETN